MIWTIQEVCCTRLKSMNYLVLFSKKQRIDQIFYFKNDENLKKIAKAKDVILKDIKSSA